MKFRWLTQITVTLTTLVNKMVLAFLGVLSLGAVHCFYVALNRGCGGGRLRVDMFRPWSPNDARGPAD